MTQKIRAKHVRRVTKCANAAFAAARRRALRCFKEGFASTLSPGDHFFFAGLSLEVERIKDTDIIATGKAAGLEVIDVEYVFDEAGRFNPKFKPGSERVIDCDTVILAIGQRANLDLLGGAEDIVISPRGLVQIDPDTMQTSALDVFAGGDVAFGPRLIISAERDGHIAALGIEQRIQGRKVQVQLVTEWTDLTGHAMFADWTKKPRQKVPALPVDRRDRVDREPDRV